MEYNQLNNRKCTLIGALLVVIVLIVVGTAFCSRQDKTDKEDNKAPVSSEEEKIDGNNTLTERKPTDSEEESDFEELLEEEESVQNEEESDFEELLDKEEPVQNKEEDETPSDGTGVTGDASSSTSDFVVEEDLETGFGPIR